MYEDLNIRRVINARGSVSLFGGTHVRPEAIAAMSDARRYHVSIVELQQRLHDRLAELTRNEAAAITNGCASAVAYAVLACLCSRAPEALYQLPDTRGLQRRFIVVQRCQYTPYIANVKQMGGVVREVGDILGTSPAEMSAALNEEAAAVLYSAGIPYEKHALPLAQVIEIARAQGVPVIVDAAELLPPLCHLWRFTEQGADLVAFSGGKGLRGPQDSGLLLGRKDLLTLVHHALSPRHGIGRSMKMSKEDMVGLVAAVESGLAEDEDAVFQALYTRAERVCALVNGRVGVTARTVPFGRYGQTLPRAVIGLARESGWSASRLLSTLAEGDPRIELGAMDDDPNAVYVSPFYLSPEEEEIVLNALDRLLVRST